MEHLNFSENLRTLLQQYPSIVKAAQEFGLSRQQVNKYLNGTRMPSIDTLKIIADSAGLRPDDLLLPPQAFEQLWQPPLRLQGVSDRVEKEMDRLFKNMAQSKEALAAYCGSYHVFARLHSNPDKIGRAYSVVAQEGSLTLIKTIMYMDAFGKGIECRPPTKLAGVMQLLGERIYIHDMQDIGKSNARLHSFVLDQPSLPLQPYVVGLMMTTHNAHMRPTYTMPVVFEKLLGPRSMRADLKACGVFHENDPQLHPEVLRML